MSNNNILVHISIFASAVLILAFVWSENQEEPPLPTGDYCGESPPADEPVMFAKEFLMTGMNERDTTFSPDGNELYFTITVNNTWAIVVSRRIDDTWQKPVVADFSGHYQDIEPMFSPDGQKLFFVSDRPLDGSPQAGTHYDIWYVERTENGWSEPVNPGAPVNAEGQEFYPSVTNDGTIYFCSRATQPDKVFRCRLVDGEYQERELISEGIIHHGSGYNPFIATDESYLIFSSTRRDGGEDFGGGDMYISFRKDDDTWTPVVNMGSKINSPSIEFCPSVTNDGKYLFFTSRRISDEMPVFDESFDADSLKTIMKEPGMGNFDIYWVDAGIIDTLRASAMADEEGAENE